MLHQHPTDRQLAALIDGRLSEHESERLRGHIAGCPRCQMLIGDADEGVGHIIPDDFEPIPVDLPAEERQAVPTQGDIWRLTWDETTALAAIWEATADALSVLPILDTFDADEWCVLFSPDITSGLGEFAVSVARAVEVPWSVLDVRIGELLDLAPIEQLRDALDRGLDSADVLRGAPILSDFDDRIPTLEEVTKTMELFASAVWTGDSDTGPAAAIGYDAALAVGLEVPRALAVGVRGAIPTEEEADLIEAGTGQRPSPASIPTALRRAIDQPFRKVPIRARALAAHHSEAVERMRIALAAQPALHAARGTRGEPPDYELIVGRLLDE